MRNIRIYIQVSAVQEITYINIVYTFEIHFSIEDLKEMKVGGVT